MKKNREDGTKFEKVKIKESILIFLINHERRIKNYLKSLEKSGSLANDQYKKIKAIGSKPGILYGLCKVHKAIIDVFPPFRPMLSAIETPSYELAKYLVSKLPLTRSEMSLITFNEFFVKDSFDFAAEIVRQDGKLFLDSPDVDSLFPSIPLKETNNLPYNNVNIIEGIN